VTTNGQDGAGSGSGPRDGDEGAAAGWFDGPAGDDAIAQEMRAGAAPIARIIPIITQLSPDLVDEPTIAVIPAVTVAAENWRQVVAGDSEGELVDLVCSGEGGWLSKQITTAVRWTVAPLEGTDDLIMVDLSAVWVRMDATITGVGDGSFALAAPASTLARNLWCVAMSPRLIVMPDEVADDVLQPDGYRAPVDMDTVTAAFEVSLHAAISEREAIRDLIVRAAWPGFDLLNSPGH
jgi:hypothetical protein